MPHPDLPAQLDWYVEQYAHEPSAENAFGLSFLKQTPARALLSHLEKSASVVSFIQDKPKVETKDALASAMPGMEARAAAHRALMAKLKGGAL